MGEPHAKAPRRKERLKEGKEGHFFFLPLPLGAFAEILLLLQYGLRRRKRPSQQGRPTHFLKFLSEPQRGLQTETSAR
jgi:hypothetical protein